MLVVFICFIYIAVCAVMVHLIITSMPKQRRKIIVDNLIANMLLLVVAVSVTMAALKHVKDESKPKLILTPDDIKAIMAYVVVSVVMREIYKDLEPSKLEELQKVVEKR